MVIDECTKDGSNNIQAWHLEAGDKTLEVIGNGQEVGRRLVVDITKPIKAKKLKLVIDKALDEPAIRELEVYNWPWTVTK